MSPGPQGVITLRSGNFYFKGEYSNMIYERFFIVFYFGRGGKKEFREYVEP